MSYYSPAFKVNSIDTTSAGDSFTGYFLACICKGQSIESSIELANTAAGICTTRSGAAHSIPFYGEVINYVYKE